MIDDKYLILINKEIDHTISKREKRKLDQYLETNPEALSFYNQIIKSEKLLDEIPDVEPSINLKKKILNSIDYSLYSAKHTHPSALHSLSNIFSGSHRKIAVSFALGLLLGIVVSVLISYHIINGSNEVNNVYGTMGMTETKFVKSVELNTDDFYGNVQISEGTDFYNLNFNIVSNDNYDIRLEYDPSQTNVKDFFCADLDNVKFLKGNNYVQISSSNASHYSINLRSDKLHQEKILVKVIRNNHSLLEKNIAISN